MFAHDGGSNKAMKLTASVGNIFSVLLHKWFWFYSCNFYQRELKNQGSDSDFRRFQNYYRRGIYKHEYKIKFKKINVPNLLK